MKRRDFFVEQIANKEFIEDVMKSIAWTTLCGAVFAMSIAALKAGLYFQGLFVFSVFIALATMSLMYVALYVAIPLDASIFPKDPYWDQKAKELRGIQKVVEALKIFISRKYFVYFALCISYFVYANQVAEYISGKINA